MVMAAPNPRAPTRKQLSKFLGEDKRLIKSFEQLFDVVPDDLTGLFDEIKANQDLFIGPAIGNIYARISEIVKRLDQDIQFKTSDYTLLNNDSGAIFDTASESLIATMPDAADWKNEDKFVQNSGANQVSIELNGTQTVSGVEVLLIPADTPYPVANMKSDGNNLILLSDRNGSNVIGADYWETQLGEQLTTQLGERLVFRV